MAVINKHLYSEIGYECQEEKIVVNINDKGKATSCYIADCDYSNEDWIYNIKCKIKRMMESRISDKITDVITNIINE